MDKQIYEKITAKKEFSQLPKRDVEMIWKKFERREVSPVEKIRLTRALLHKVFAAFVSRKILSKEIVDKKSVEEVMKKHLSTRERLPYYKELYERLLKDFVSEKITVFDLGAGINGFSYNYFPFVLDYVAIESVGQLVDLMSYYFKTRGIDNAWAVQESLFELDKIVNMIKQVKGIRVVFLFKTLDSLEMVERDYSKKLLKEIVPLVDKVVVSFATRSLVSKKEFNVKRYWFENFVKENFKVLDDFELGGERYIVFCK